MSTVQGIEVKGMFFVTILLRVPEALPALFPLHLPGRLAGEPVRKAGEPAVLLPEATQPAYPVLEILRFRSASLQRKVSPGLPESPQAAALPG